MVQAKEVIVLATNGGLSHGRATFGVFVSLQDGALWENSGPVDDDPATSNSKCSDIAGYVVSLELLAMLITLCSNLRLGDTIIQVETITWMDRVGARNCLRNLMKSVHSHCKYPHDPDLLAHICWCGVNYPISPTIFNGLKAIRTKTGATMTYPIMLK